MRSIAYRQFDCYVIVILMGAQYDKIKRLYDDQIQARVPFIFRSILPFSCVDSSDFPTQIIFVDIIHAHRVGPNRKPLYTSANHAKLARTHIKGRGVIQG